ncbi:stress transcription factor B-2b [Seminavis robusta]|uniref:Stress transcription factor B-2b n=1 Tax=Seminavis robusta TaxID=568900 RepID=A0A9N8EEK3_9STRA|nr:stress transcription factor B-2b [Seminavis robusta]|eukprot:Sro1068_g237480.1 stress transcription factor B-2b (394) ;mRNA; r:16741-18029
MCVTNTTSRRPPAIALAPEMVANSSSMLSQRLFGNLFPTVETGANAACAPPAIQAEQPVNNYACNYFNNTSVTIEPKEEKPRPKRRRKPQKPGKTAKQNDRHFVVHNYHDHANEPDENDDEEEPHRRRGGVSIAFPLKLHAVLDQVEADGLGHVISWQPHGRSFVVHKPKEFVDHVMPKYFRQTKLTSFQRQLNLYGFSRLTRGGDAGGYYHELFLRGKQYLCKKMIRTKVKGTKFKAASSPDSEPDFYKMPPVVVTPPHSIDEEYSYASSSQQEQLPYAMAPVAAAPVQAYDPLPVSFSNMVAQAPVADTRVVYEAAPASIPYAAMPESIHSVPERNYADQVLDEAVDELFLQEALMENESSIAPWDASSFGDDASLQDEQLGMLLEQLLEE